MDMYQKRKIRAEKKNNDSQKSFPSVGINWLITINLNPYGNHCKIRKNSNLNLAYFC